LNEETGFNNTLNSMMDHMWDGFYTGQVRMSRFPGILSTDADYTIEMSGTPPKVMRFKLDADIGGVKIRIPYPVAGSIKVYADGKAQDYTPWSNDLGRP
jgi:flagellar basal body-associated protein FliL